MPHRLTTPRSSRARRLLVGVGSLVLAGSLAPGTVHADEAPRPAPGTAWFGAELDWVEDSLEAYERRFDLRTSMVARSVSYPLTRSSVRDLDQLAAAADGERLAVVDLRPAAVLGSLRPSDAAQLTTRLNRLSRETGSSFLVRFGAEMNGTWTPWGQQPTAYVAAFRDVARVLDARALAASTVWSPVYGAGYPFGGALSGMPSRGVLASSTGPRDVDALDTSGNGVLDPSDDPYGPYYPGDRFVDWVGLSMLRFGVAQRFGANIAPGADELRQRLDEEFGYPSATPRRSFYDRFAEGADRPMLLSTAALFNPAADGASEKDVKLGWLRRVATAVRSRPLVQGILWLEDVRYEPEVGERVRWGLSPDAAVRDAATALIRSGPFDLGPVPTPDDLESAVEADEGSAARDEEESSDADQRDSDGGEAAGGRDDQGVSPLTIVVVSASLGLLVVALVALRVRRRRMRPPWLA